MSPSSPIRGPARDPGAARARIGCLLALTAAGCTSLEGRARDDAGLDDARDAADSAPADAPTDRPPGDVPRCERGAVPQAVGAWTTALDTAAPTPLQRLNVRDVRADAQGRVYVAGFYDRAGPPTFRGAVWRFRADEPVLDATWGDGGRALEPDGTNAAIAWTGIRFDAVGRVLLAGFEERDGRVTTILRRLGPEGAPDPTFGVGGHVVVPSDVWPISTTGMYPYGFALGPRGALSVGSDHPISARNPQRAMAVAVDAEGRVLTDFGDRGLWFDNTLHGCFDVRPDADGWVLACMDRDDRPELVRLDERGRRDAAWRARATAEASLPEGFHVRSMDRDSAGRWLVAGVISRGYDKRIGPVALVRYHPDGGLDRAFGSQGVAVVHDGRNSFVYSGSSMLTVGCEDRALLGASNLYHPLIEVFDAQGRWMPQVSPSGYLMGLAHPSLTNTIYAVFLTAVTPHDVLMVVPSASSRVLLARFNL